MVVVTIIILVSFKCYSYKIQKDLELSCCPEDLYLSCVSSAGCYVA
jgi:hypothetical protein